MSTTEQLDSDTPVAGGRDARSPCVHVGLPKTATTTVQQFLFPRHPGIYYLGRWIDSRRLFSREIQRMILAIRGGKATISEVARFRQQFTELRQSPPVRNKVVVLSDESLVTGSPDRRRRRAEALRNVFGPSRVMITLRRPEALIESLYFQKLANEQVDGRRPIGRRLAHFTIEEWLEANWARSERGSLAVLDYARTIELFAAVFGKDAVGVFLIEQLAQDADAYYRAICRFVGVDEQQGLALVRDQRANSRLPQQTIDRLRQISESKFRSVLFRYSPRRLRRRMAGVDSDHVSSRQMRAYQPIPESWRQRVIELTRDGNRRLAKEFGVPLHQFGYPM